MYASLPYYRSEILESASCYSRKGIHVVWTRPRGAEIYAMRDNDKDMGIPSMTFESIVKKEDRELCQRCDEIKAMARHDKKDREIEGMSSNDYRILWQLRGVDRTGPVYQPYRMPFSQCPNYGAHGQHVLYQRRQNKRRRIDLYACGVWNCWKHVQLDRE